MYAVTIKTEETAEMDTCAHKKISIGKSINEILKMKLKLLDW